MTDLTPEGLDALAAMEAAATPGPWGAADEHGLLGPDATPAWCVSRMSADGGTWLYDVAETMGDREAEDAAFIAAIRTAAPDLIAAARRVEAAETERDELRERVAQYEGAITWGTTCLNCSNMLDQCYAAHAERDASRTAHAALVAELRALPRTDLTDTGERPGRWVVIDADDLDALLDTEETP